jgi:hypothetical protein
VNSGEQDQSEFSHRAIMTLPRRLSLVPVTMTWRMWLTDAVVSGEAVLLDQLTDVITALRAHLVPSTRSTSSLPSMSPKMR